MSVSGSRGFTLLEVMVAMVLVSIALLGLAKLQAFGMSNTGGAYYRTQATTFLNDIVERSRVNPGADYIWTSAAACAAAPPNNCRYIENEEIVVSEMCSADEFAAWDLFSVVCGEHIVEEDQEPLGIAHLLPGGRLNMSCPIKEKCTASVSWTEVGRDKADDAAVLATGKTRSVALEFLR